MGLLRELRYELSTLVFGLGVLSMFVAVTNQFFAGSSPEWLRSIHLGLGNYVFWVGILGFFALLVGGYYFIDTIRKEREFERLVSTTSKEVFLKNLKRIEELAYYNLPSSYEKRMSEKKAEFRIKA